MKTLQKAPVALIFLCLFTIVLSSCEDRCTEINSYVYFEPVYTPVSVIRASVKMEEPQPLGTVGKIYFKDDFLYVSEPGKGIHVIDNHNPENPIVKAFIAIPGNNDLAIRNYILYADSYMDLVAIDISNPAQIREVSRMENVFTQYGWYSNPNNTLGVITGWTEKGMREVASCDVRMQWWGGHVMEDGVVFQSGFSPTSVGNNTNGIGGSMARFTLTQDHLYLLDNELLHAFDVQEPIAPAKKSTQTVSWDIETIFPNSDKLFIGSRSGMHIYGLTDPANPEKLATYQHVTSCDPVVVNGDYAYVTLRSGTECNGFTNQLEVLDISTITDPQLVKIYPMTNPHGLGIDNSTLFICDGAAGLKIYDATDKLSIDSNLLEHYDNIHAFDVIPFNNILMLIGADGILQYDYSDLSNIRLLSHIRPAVDEE